MKIRSYQPDDRDACLELMRSNTPRYFASRELEDFDTFLAASKAPYLVVEDEGHLVGCGGIFIKPDGQTAGLCWGMVRHDHHRRGYGTALLQARIDWLSEHAPQVNQLDLDTSQHSVPFFKRFGFETFKMQPNYYAPGLNRYDMRLHLNGPHHSLRPESEASTP